MTFQDVSQINQNYTTDDQLIKFARANHIPLQAVCSKDKIPTHLKNGTGLIINMADSDAIGTHWFVTFVKGNTAIYWDSFGMPSPIEVAHALRGYKVTVNTQEVQSYNSGWCGAYSLLAIWFISRISKQRGVTLPVALARFNRLWSTDYSKNRRILQGYLTS